MASQRDDGGAAEAEGQVSCQLRAGDAAHAVGSEETSHDAKATRAAVRSPGRPVLWEHRRMSDSPVRVYASSNAFDGLLTKGHLEAEGITVLMKGEGEGPYRAGPVYLWVMPAEEDRAREIIRAIESGAYATSDDDVLQTEERAHPPGDVSNERPLR